jgi:hypothetical protein
VSQPPPTPPERFFGWIRRTTPPIGFYAELWRDPEEKPDLPALAEKYGEQQALTEVAMLRLAVEQDAPLSFDW